MKNFSGIKIIFKFILFLNFICAFIVILGLNKKFKIPFQNYEALNNVEEFFENDTLIIENINVYSGSGKKTNSYTTVISGKILNTKIDKSITFLYQDDFYIKLVFKQKINGKSVDLIKIIRNKITSEILIKNSRLIKYKKRESIIEIYCLCSIFPSLIIFTLLTKKRKNEF